MAFAARRVGNYAESIWLYAGKSEYPALPSDVRLDVYHGENVTGADNQQERLVRLGWVLGFVDGEGCFSIGFVRQPDRPERRGYSTGYQVFHRFVVTQGARSAGCLEEIRDFFGVGRIYENKRHDNHKEHLLQYIVGRRDESHRRDHSVLPPASVADFEAIGLREVRGVHGHSPSESAPDPRRVDQGRRARGDDEPSQIQTRADQNPQRPYARHPGHWMKIWSHLHGDMQRTASKGSAVLLRHVRKG